MDLKLQFRVIDDFEMSLSLVWQEHRLLLEQLRNFPQGKFDDGPDALEMAIQLAQKPKGEIRVFICGGGRDDEDWGHFNRVVRG